MRALVLSGGGSKAAFQLGVIKHLIQTEGKDYDIYCGSSAGAINAGILAQNNIQKSYFNLEQLWLSIKNNNYVYTNTKLNLFIYLVIFSAILGLAPLIVASFDLIFGIIVFVIYLVLLLFPIKYIFELDGLYDNTPLKNLLKNNINISEIIKNNKKLLIGVVNYEFGKFETFTEYDENIINYIIASSAFPIFFPLEKINGQHWTDGGVLNLAPVTAAINAGADEIDIIICNNLEPNIEENKLLPYQVNRVLELMSTEILRNDLVIFDESKKIRIFYPLDPLDFSLLEFNQENINKAIKIGESSAKIILDSKKYKSWGK